MLVWQWEIDTTSPTTWVYSLQIWMQDQVLLKINTLLDHMKKVHMIDPLKKEWIGKSR